MKKAEKRNLPGIRTHEVRHTRPKPIYPAPRVPNKFSVGVEFPVLHIYSRCPTTKDTPIKVIPTFRDPKLLFPAPRKPIKFSVGVEFPVNNIYTNRPKAKK